MLLTVLGCSGSAPGPNAPTSGYLLEAGGFLLGIELGTGTLAALQAIRDPFSLDALLFSHLHPDHCSDFAGLTVLRRYHSAPSRDPRVNPLPVYAPSEAPSRFTAAYSPDEADRLQTDLSDVYTFHPLSPGSVHIGPFEITVIRANHPPESYSFRISHGGRSFVYTGDTGLFDGLVDLASGVDVLLAEASWTHADDRPSGLHLSGKEAGELAKRSGAARLLVTHVPPWTEAEAVFAEARAEYPGDAVLVRQGASYPI
ncbi:MAG TPA: MBL fold metallo-hydrolase [Actinophytocola sp.]|uniref:MBL fold metallo-hydrolase n=1 Tax=Actinophytocola sp. TaxID=1872138 RepID=UPI002DDCD67A|nr:MBL fold metallo-hydrolase [Actinophytocola sp.]HEV2780286.1 MBL fold metallo-hydrolase [Actinophytocola sp.]